MKKSQRGPAWFDDQKPREDAYADGAKLRKCIDFLKLITEPTKKTNRKVAWRGLGRTGGKKAVGPKKNQKTHRGELEKSGLTVVFRKGRGPSEGVL